MRAIGPLVRQHAFERRQPFCRFLRIGIGIHFHRSAPIGRTIFRNITA
jgi:hypothetical protein